VAGGMVRRCAPCVLAVFELVGQLYLLSARWWTVLVGDRLEKVDALGDRWIGCDGGLCLGL